ncbi:MAG: formimidoylglutamase [Candidatus Aegiribacteria sp.]|nr:formimidoylglutamase [Candidatus Aegiribacteria sp.]
MKTAKVMDHVIPAEDGVFYTRNDPNDIRFGDIVLRDIEHYSTAQVVILGCPQDEGITRNRGRPGARYAPTEIRRDLYRYPVTQSHKHLNLMDLGDLEIRDTLENTHELLTSTVRKLIANGKKVIVLGGGNDISYPDCLALTAQTRKPLVFNIDRHLDVRADKPRNSGTSYRQLLEEGIIEPCMFHEFGINSFANSPKYLEYVLNIGANIHYLGDLRAAGVGKSLRTIVNGSDSDGIFFGFDLDAVRSIEAPGVSDPGPMGFSAREVCEIADVAASDPRTRIIEITEVCPEFDRDRLTSKLAANIIVRALAEDTEQK